MQKSCINHYSHYLLGFISSRQLEGLARQMEGAQGCLPAAGCLDLKPSCACCDAGLDLTSPEDQGLDCSLRYLGRIPGVPQGSCQSSSQKTERTPKYLGRPWNHLGESQGRPGPFKGACQTPDAQRQEQGSKVCPACQDTSKAWVNPLCKDAMNKGGSAVISASPAQSQHSTERARIG